MPKPKNHNTIVALAERLLGAKLSHHQRRILQAVMRSRRVAIASCHAVGKSYVLAVLAIVWAVMYEDARVLILTPGWLMNRAVIWSEIDALLARAAHRLPIVSRTQTELRFGPKNLVIGLSAADSGRLQGHHSQHLLIICDEVSALDPSFFPAIEGLLAAGDGTRLVISGNPVVASGPLYDAFGRHRANWEAIQISAFDTDNFDGVSLETLLSMTEDELDDNRLPFLITRRWAKERYAEWFNGSIENSPLWASRVLGIFPTSSTNALIPLAALETARRAPIDPGGDMIVGVDVAGPGRDRTVCTAVAGGAIVETGIFTDAEAQGPVIAFVRRYSQRVRIVRVDSAGTGWYFIGYIRDAGFRVEGVNVGTAAREKDRFQNSKAERYWFLRERFQRGEISGLSDEALSELAAINYVIDPSGRTAIEDKASVKSTLGRSPDLAESLMIALGEGPPQPYEYTPANGSLRRTSYPLTYPTPQIELTGEEIAAREDGGVSGAVAFARIFGRARFGRGAW